MPRFDGTARVLTQAARALLRRPVMTVVGLTTLGLGIGANTAMFSVINVVFLKPLPFHEPERLTMVWTDLRDQNLADGFSSYPDFKDWREQSKSFSGLATFWMFPNGDVNLTGGSQPQRVSVARVTPDFFGVLGVRPLHGRVFQEEETIIGNHRRAILSYGLWRDTFGADASLVGRNVMVNGVPYTVVGIMPEDLQARAVRALGTDVQLWRPLVPDDNQTGGRGSRRLRVVGRLAAGVSHQQAESELSSISQRLAELYPQTNRNTATRVVPVREQLVKDVRYGLLLLLGAVAVVLLGACANVANLLLIKAAGDRKQLAVRNALGASRLQLGTQVVSEALLLGAGGVLVGLVIAFGILRAFVAFGPADIPLLADAGIDLTVLSFAVLATMLSVALAAALPAWRATQPDNGLLLRQSSGRARNRDERRAMRILSVTQIALAMVLLTTGGLLIRSFTELLRVDPGIRSEGVLTFQVELPMAATATYPEQSQRDAFFQALADRLAALPEVTATALASSPPLEEEPAESALRLPDDAEGTTRQASFRLVSADYFDLLEIPLLRGRSFGPADVKGAPRVVMVSNALAKSIWGTEAAVGKRIMVSSREEAEVIGVVGDVRSGGLDVGPGRTVYVPASQGTYNFMTVLVRTELTPRAIIRSARDVVRGMDAQIPLHHVRPLPEIVTASIAHQRFQMLLATGFSALMLVLAVVGVYGVTAYAVGERTRELGIRSALGATADDIRRLVLGEGVGLALTGIGIGTAGAVVATMLASRFMPAVGQADPLTFLAVAVILAGAMLLATFIPARRASNASPLTALRSE